jgi:hypothetical protein
MDTHNRVIDIMTEGLRTVGKNNITKEEMLPALVDFTAAVALILGGEIGLLAVIGRMEARLGHWKAGEFPAPDSCSLKPKRKRKIGDVKGAESYVASARGNIG